MRYKIENEYLTVEVDSLGAELKSLQSKKTSQEYMWCGDPAYYKRTSPILFPIVGSLKDKQYEYEGKKYTLPQHGFARDMEFERIKATEDEMWFMLRYNDETFEKYPFEFDFRIGYKLVDKTLRVMWKIYNLGEMPMCFSIGSHSEFNCPLHGEENKQKYTLNFHTNHGILFSKLNEEGLLLNNKNELLLEDGICSIPDDFFDEGAYVIENYQVNKVSLLDPEGKAYITVDFDAPVVGIWSPEKKNAPFVAIEPWFGRCDRETFDGRLCDREWSNTIGVGEIFDKHYKITVGEI